MNGLLKLALTQISDQATRDLVKGLAQRNEELETTLRAMRDLILEAARQDGMFECTRDLLTDKIDQALSAPQTGGEE
jgi:hypothetical protein